MKLFAALLIIVFIAFSGYHLSFRSFRLPVFARTFYMTGIEYLFLGLLLGPQFLNLLDPATLSGMAPLSALLLGWVGLLCGFQCELSGIKKFPKSFFGASLLESAVSFAFVFTVLYATLPICFTLSGPHLLLASTGFAAAATCSAQTGLSLLMTETIKNRSRVVNFLRHVTSINAMAALVFFSFVFLFNPGNGTQVGLFFSTTPFSIISVLVANIALIVLYNLFLSKRKEQKELALILIGLVILTSGAATSMGFSPLLANFVLGACLANTRREKERIFSLLIWAEKPLYLLLLVFMGASWDIGGFHCLWFPVLFVLIRFSAKLISGFAASRVCGPDNIVPPYLGMGLLEQGGVPLAIYFDMSQAFPGPIMTQLVGIAVIALVISDMASPRMLVAMINLDRPENQE